MTIKKQSRSSGPESDLPSKREMWGGRREGAGRPSKVQIGLRKVATTRSLVPVEVHAMAVPVGIAITSPTGFRIEGLTFEQACSLLRVLA